MRESILVLHKSRLKELPPSIEELKNSFNAYGLWMERSFAENDDNYLQIIPYTVVRQHNKIFCYQRLSKSGEARLHGKLSIGVGGHVDRNDWIAAEMLSLWKAVEDSAAREVCEELQVSISELSKITFTDSVIYTPINPVGRVHIGVCCIVDIQTEKEVKIREIDKLEGSFLTLSELSELELDAFEDWSQITISNLFKEPIDD